MFKVQVIGTIWSGWDAAYEYEMPSLPDNDSQMHRAVKALAGDFAHVEDFAVLEPRVCAHGHFDGYNTISDWAIPESQDKYLAATFDA